MVQPKYSPEEALERVKLMMKYDISKTLNENKRVVSEQSEHDYFATVIKSFMKYPNNIPNLNFGSPNIEMAPRVQSLSRAISPKKTFGLGRDTKGIEYTVNQTLTTLPNSFEFFKKYPEIAGESLYDAIDGEWFSSKIMNNVVSKVSSQLKEWCSLPANQKNDVCRVKTKEQLKYGF